MLARQTPFLVKLDFVCCCCTLPTSPAARGNQGGGTPPSQPEGNDWSKKGRKSHRVYRADTVEGPRDAYRPKTKIYGYLARNRYLPTYKQSSPLPPLPPSFPSTTPEASLPIHTPPPIFSACRPRLSCPIPGSSLAVGLSSTMAGWAP